MVVGVNIVVNRIIAMGGGDFLRLAVQSSTNTVTAVFLFDKEGLHPHAPAVNAANRITCLFVIYKSRKHREPGGKILFHFLTSGFDIGL